jgi:hypothetical protein
VKREPWASPARPKGNRPTRGKPSLCIYANQWTRRAAPSATPFRPPMRVQLKRLENLASAPEAWKRGWSRAVENVVGDGAEWIWNIAAQHFPGAIQIVDLYHARSHLWDLARKLYPNDEVHQVAHARLAAACYTTGTRFRGAHVAAAPQATPS